MKNIETKFNGALSDFDMISDGDTVIVAISGGADSMCLLHLLDSIREKRSLKLVCAHVNHMLRGEDSFRDEEKSYRAAFNMGLEFCSIRVNINLKAKKENLGIEEAAREARYAFFSDLSQEYGPKVKVATGHNLSDSCETLLFNIIRGASISAMRGIPPKRGNIVRPLIYATREEIRNYCRENLVEYCEDKTNEDLRFTRNKIREKIMPVAREINPSFEQAMLRLMRSAAEEEAYFAGVLKEIKDKAYKDNGYSIEYLNNLDEAVLNRLIAGMISENPNSRKIDLIKEIITAKNGAVEIKANVRARVKGGSLVVEEEKEEESSYCGWKIKFNGEEVLTPWGDKFIIRVLNHEQILKTSKLEFNNLVDYDTINEYTVFRTRNAGDNFITRGNNIGKSFKKLMQENGISAGQRNNLLVLSRGDSILWVEKIGASNEGCVSSDTRKAVLIIKQ